MASAKQKLWLAEYLKCFNASEAARRAGYKWPGKIGPRLKQKFAEQINAILDERAMEAEEALAILGDQARADLGDFMDIENMFFRLNLDKAREKGLTHIIRKVRDRVVMTSNQDGEETETHSLEIELYDAQAAIDKILRVAGRYKDNLNVNVRSYDVEFTDDG